MQSVAELNTNEGESASTHQYYLEIQYKGISKLLFLVICRLFFCWQQMSFLDIFANFNECFRPLHCFFHYTFSLVFFIRGCKFIVIVIFAKIASPHWAGHGLIWPYSPSSTTGFLLQYLYIKMIKRSINTRSINTMLHV